MKEENNAGKTGQEQKVIVIAEDDIMYQCVISNYLHKCKYKVNMFENGKDAMLFIDNNRFDLLITDINMPLMNGLELIWHVRKAVSATVPIVAMSSISEERLSSRLISLGATRFMQKPYSMTDITSCITELIGST